MRAGAAMLAMRVASGSAASSRRGVSRASSRAAQAERPPPRRVLVIDGDANARRVLQSRLVREGYEVAVAQSAAQAFELLFSVEALPLAVIASTELSDGDGFQLTVDLRKDVQTAHVPVILLGRGDSAERAAACGADAYLPRPLYVNDVLTLVKLEESRRVLDDGRHLSTSEVPLHLLVRALAATAKSARLSVDGGQLVFSQGRLVNAAYRELTGEGALRRMVLLHRGDCTVTFGTTLTTAKLSLTLEELCERVLPSVERWRRSADDATLSARWAIDFAKLSKTVHLLPPGTSRLLRLCDGARTVEQVICDSDLDEVAALEALVSMYETGILVATAPRPSQRTGRGRLRLAPLEVVEANAEGTAANVDEGLAPELQQQLRAFNIKPVRDVANAVGPVVARTAPAPVAAAPAEQVAPAPQAAADVPAPGSSLLAAQRIGALLGAAALIASAVALLIPARESDARAIAQRAAASVPAMMKQPEAAATPVAAEAWVALAEARAVGGDLRGAERAAQAALEQHPDDPAALIVLATVYLELGKSEHAAQALRRYVQVAPDGPHVGQALQLLAGGE